MPAFCRRVHRAPSYRLMTASLPLLAMVAALHTTLTHAAPGFLLFESGPVRPLALGADGDTLLAANTPNNTLEIFKLDDAGPQATATVPVGLEPVAVAVRDNNEVWVVNHLSDSVSIVRMDGPKPRVTRTLLVGDEPRDIVFAGPNRSRAFITTAHRGQQRTAAELSAVPGAGDPRLQSPGVPRADVWVFDAERLDNAGAPGVPLKIIELFGDTPRALAVSPDARTVYAAVFNSGNQTTVVSSGVVCLNFKTSPCVRQGVEYPGGSPGPGTNHAGARAPQTALIVKYNPQSNHFEDELGRNWDAGVKFSLPDNDVFAIDAMALQEHRTIQHVGTTLFNMVVNPVSGTLYVSNTEANNSQRFEGPGLFGGSTVQGHLAESRITVVKGDSVLPRHLNKHIDYRVLPAAPDTARHSLATPLDMVTSPDGKTLYVAAFGSSRVGVFDLNALESDSFDPRDISSGYIDVPGGGPGGLALDAARNRLYVLTRFDNAVAAVDLPSRREIAHVLMANPEPDSVRAGRRFLYDARLTSSNGEASCSSCHIFGHTDHLDWDLGNPDEDVTINAGPIKLELGTATLRELGPVNGTGSARDFHPMKGPMSTQSLRGMVNHGPMHWRGDRSNGFFGKDRKRSAPFDSRLSFKNFIVAFQGLNGRQSPLSEQEMNQFTDFALQMVMPPNPVRRLDNSLTTAQRAGRRFYFGCESAGLSICTGAGSGLFAHNSDGLPLLPTVGFTCAGCHTLNPARGFFGTDGTASFESLSQIIKIPHLRNMYEKVGMFGHPDVYVIRPGNNGHQGPQIRGFGFLHDGTNDTLMRFFNAKVFQSNVVGQVGFFGGDPQRSNVVDYVFAFDNDIAPIVGQQVTYTANASSQSNARVQLLVDRANADFISALLGGRSKECELVATGLIGGTRVAWLYSAARRRFVPTGGNGRELTLEQLFATAAESGQEQTFTCVPTGSGTRVATASISAN